MIQIHGIARRAAQGLGPFANTAHDQVGRSQRELAHRHHRDHAAGADRAGGIGRNHRVGAGVGDLQVAQNQGACAGAGQGRVRTENKAAIRLLAGVEIGPVQRQKQMHHSRPARNRAHQREVGSLLLSQGRGRHCQSGGRSIKIKNRVRAGHGRPASAGDLDIVGSSITGLRVGNRQNRSRHAGIIPRVAQLARGVVPLVSRARSASPKGNGGGASRHRFRDSRRLNRNIRVVDGKGRRHRGHGAADGIGHDQGVAAVIRTGYVGDSQCYIHGEWAAGVGPLRADDGAAVGLASVDQHGGTIVPSIRYG